MKQISTYSSLIVLHLLHFGLFLMGSCNTDENTPAECVGIENPFTSEECSEALMAQCRAIATEGDCWAAPGGTPSELNVMNQSIYVRLVLVAEDDDGMGEWGGTNGVLYKIPASQRLFNNPDNDNDGYDLNSSNNVFATISVPVTDFNASPQLLAGFSRLDIQFVAQGPEGPQLSGEVLITNVRFAPNA